MGSPFDFTFDVQAAVDVTHTDANEADKVLRGVGNPGDIPGSMGGQSVTGPAPLRDYDNPDNLTLDHNRKMPYHEGSAPTDDERRERQAAAMDWYSWLEAEATRLAGQTIETLEHEHRMDHPESGENASGMEMGLSLPMYLEMLDPREADLGELEVLPEGWGEEDAQEAVGVRASEILAEMLEADASMYASSVQLREQKKKKDERNQRRRERRQQKRDEWEPEDDLDKDAEFGNSLREMGNGRMEPPLSRGQLWDQSYTQDEGGGSTIHMGSQQPSQQELARMVRDQGGRMAPVPGGRYTYLAATNPEAPTIMYDTERDEYFVGQPVRYVQAQRAPWVAVDLDGTILEQSNTDVAQRDPREQQAPLGLPKPGAASVLSELASLGWRISIYTARFGDEQLQDEIIERWAEEISDHLRRHEIPFSDIWVGRKPRADYFIDDKAVAFQGDWDRILEQLAVETIPDRHTEPDPGDVVETLEPEAGYDPVFGAGESDNDWVDMSWGQRHPPEAPTDGNGNTHPVIGH